MVLYRYISYFLLLGLAWACAGTPQNTEDPIGPSDPQDIEFTENRFKVYTHYRPQVQYRDFNGVFNINPDGAQIVRKFWKERFNALTRPGHHGEFFLEFYEYMSALAQTHPAETRQKERMLDRLERSFQAFCMALKVEEAFEAFQKEQLRIYGD